MIVSVHQPHYIPWLGYFDKIDKSDCFVYLDTVQYKKREFINRNKIRTKDNWVWLTVPVKTKGSFKQKICDVLIDNETNWADDHKKNIQFWYGKAPFFKEYFPFLEQTFATNWERLIDLNVHIIAYILKQLEINTPICLESELSTQQQSTARIIEICHKLKADTYLSGIGGKDYLEEDLFEKQGIKLEYQKFQHPHYVQQFMTDFHPFEPYMSVVDLLFNKGPESINIIRQA